MPNGSSGQQCFNIQQFINNDLIVETTEGFRISLMTDDLGVILTPGRELATIIIHDNDRMFLSLANRSQPEFSLMFCRGGDCSCAPHWS